MRLSYRLTGSFLEGTGGSVLARAEESDPQRTHTSDALGYYIAREFAMRAKMGERAEWIA
jgi:hypothetical protein